MAVSVALDIGAGTIKASLVDDTGRPLAQRRFATRGESGIGESLDRVLDALKTMLDIATSRGEVSRAIGIAVCGPVDADKATVTSVNLGWEAMPLGSAVAGLTELPVALLNDAHAGALGEQKLGSARGMQDFVYVALGTGVGSAIALRGQIYEGFRGHAAELGHVRVTTNGPRCACGSVGCLETLSSAAAIERSYALRTGAKASCREIAALVDSGDVTAGLVWEEAMHFLALGLLTISTILDPEAIVIGGGLAGAGNTLLRPLERCLASEAASFNVLPSLALATLGEWSANAGAGLEAWSRLASGSGSGGV